MDKRLIYLFSPTFLAIFQGVIAIFVITIPPKFYVDVVGEPIYYRNFPGAIFIGGCIAAFIFGLMIANLGGERKRREWVGVRKDVDFVYFSAVSFIIACIIINIYLIFGVGFSAIARAYSGSAEVYLRSTISEVKEGISAELILIGATYFAPLVWYWGRKVDDKKIRALAVVYVFLIAFSNLWNLNTASVAFLFFGVFVVQAQVEFERRSERNRVMLALALGAIGFLLFFSIIQYSRLYYMDLNYTELMLSSVVSYAAGSFNRFYALVDGVLYFPGGGRAYYATQWFWEAPIIGNGLHLHAVFEGLIGDSPPNGYSERTWWIGSGGLKSNLTAITAYGHMYHDFGFFGIIAFVPYGYVAQRTWRAFRSGSLWGFLFIPIVCWSIMEWRGYIEITRPSIVLVAYIMVARYFWGRLLYSRRRNFA